MNDTIKVFIFSDGHGKIEKIIPLTEEIENSDLILFAGDFTKFNTPKTGVPYVNEIIKFKKPTFSVLGNCDYPELLELTKEQNVSVDGMIRQYGELYITGSGGGSKFTGMTPNERTDEELVSDLKEAEKQLNANIFSANSLIVLTHNPPYKTNLDKTPTSHVGSKLIRKFVETYEPLLHISGHIHESVGVDTIGKTTLINPGSLKNGKYATCEIAKVEGFFQVKNIQLKSL